MLIIAITEDGEEISYTIYDERTDGWSSMSRTTGLTACAFTKLLISKNMLDKGMQCPEVLGMDENNYNFVISDRISGIGSHRYLRNNTSIIGVINHFNIRIH